MKQLLVIFAVLAVAFADKDASARITGGTNTAPGQFPSAVSIDSPYNLHCGGTIINRQHVLTAAWCVMHPTTFTLINPVWLRVIAGDVNLVSRTIRREVRNVTHLFVHPNYNRVTSNNDLAVIRVDNSYPEFHNTIEPALISAVIFPDNTDCLYAGWGADSITVGAPLNPIQRMIPAPIVPITQCNAANMHANRVLSTMFCAGFVNAIASTVCQGNIGGGLYCNGQLAGVLTFGLSCGAANNPGVYMDIRQYRSWIESQFTRTDNPVPGWAPNPL